MTDDINLPELPEPHVLDGHYRDHINKVSGYSREQVREAQRAAVLADRAQQAERQQLYENRLRAVLNVVRPWRAQRQAVPFNREYVHGYLSEILAEAVGGPTDPEICALMEDQHG